MRLRSFLRHLLISLVCWLIFPIPALVPSCCSDLLLEFVTQISALPPGAPLLQTERVLGRLEAAENAEVNPHFRDDYRIAWITVLYAARGYDQPHVAATYRVLGLHPEKVWASIEARRHAQLGAEYDKFFGVPSLAPKKPVRSERRACYREDDVRAA